MFDTNFSFVGILILVIYMAYTSLYSSEFDQIQVSKKRFILHLVMCIMLAIIGISIIQVSRTSMLTMGTYLIMPLLYILLLKGASKWVYSKYERPLILAHRFNMQSDRTKEAKFMDYALFFVVHFVPLLVPLFIIETILQKPI